MLRRPSLFILFSSSVFFCGLIFSVATSSTSLPSCLEFRAGLPLRELIGLGNTISHLKEQLQIFNGAAEIPIWLNFICNLVVILLSIIIPFFLTVALRLSNEVYPRVRIDCRHALLGELEMVRPVVISLFRFRIGPDNSRLRLSHLLQNVFQC